MEKIQAICLLSIGLGIPVLVALLSMVMPISPFDQISIFFAGEATGLLCLWLFAAGFKKDSPQLAE